jgi:hypothetical protein
MYFTEEQEAKIVLGLVSGKLGIGLDLRLCGEYFGTVTMLKDCAAEDCRCQGHGHVVVATGGISRSTPPRLQDYYLGGKTIMEFGLPDLLAQIDVPL